MTSYDISHICAARASLDNSRGSNDEPIGHHDRIHRISSQSADSRDICVLYRTWFWESSCSGHGCGVHE